MRARSNALREARQSLRDAVSIFEETDRDERLATATDNLLGVLNQNIQVRA